MTRGKSVTNWPGLLSTTLLYVNFVKSFVFFVEDDKQPEIRRYLLRNGARLAVCVHLALGSGGHELAHYAAHDRHGWDDGGQHQWEKPVLDVWVDKRGNAGSQEPWPMNIFVVNFPGQCISWTLPNEHPNLLTHAVLHLVKILRHPARELCRGRSIIPSPQYRWVQFENNSLPSDVLAKHGSEKLFPDAENL